LKDKYISNQIKILKNGPSGPEVLWTLIIVSW